ncbi:MAG: hypothetical protein AAGE98_19765 [Actinomycetota bacterium]
MTDWSPRAVVAVFVALTGWFFWRPLLGVGTLLPNDLLDNAAPWSAERVSERAENPWLSDTIDVHSQFAALGDDARSGDLSWWDRSLTGGLPSLKAGFSPLLLPYLVLPAAYAPGVVAALRVLVAGGSMFGYLRRGLGTHRAAALVGAIAYGFTGYLVGWASWPQSNVAAFAPALLWAVETAVTDPRPRRAVAIAGSIAALYLSNFPLAATYVVIVVAGYAVARLVVRHGHRPLDRLARAALPATTWALVGVGLGMASISIYLSEFATYVDFNDTSARDAIPADSSTGTRFVLTLVLPWAFGAAHQAPTFWADGTNWIEAQGYVGSSVVLLALVALARRGGDGRRRELAATVRILWVIAVFGLWISYIGGPLTEAFQSLPLIGANSIGRSRVVSHLAFAALAGLGTQALLERDDDTVDLRRACRVGGVALALAVVAFSPWLIDWGREARARDLLRETAEQTWLPVVAAVATIGVVVAVIRRDSPARLVIAALVTIVSVELLGFGHSVITVVDDAEGEYETAAHDVVRELLEPGERLGGDGRTFWANTNQVTGHDDVRGHVFYPAGWRDLFEEIQPGAFVSPGTITNPWFGPDADAGDPKLDALAVAVWADDPRVPVRGAAVAAVVGPIDLDPRVELDVDIPDGGIRGVRITLDDPPPDATVTAEIGGVGGERSSVGLIDGAAIDVALAGEALPIGPTTLTLTSSAPLRARTIDLVVGADDGLRLVSTGAVTLYERPHAAVAWFVPDVEPGAVDLDLHGPGAAATTPVDVRVVEGGRVELAVDADRAGTVVVSQYAFPGWSATVDGGAAPVVEVDDLITGIAVEAGAGEVVLDYTPRRLGLLTIVTVAALAGLVALWLLDDRLRVGRPRATPAPPPGPG